MEALFSSKWTLESDKQLFEILKDLSKSTIERATAVTASLSSLNEKLERVEHTTRATTIRLNNLKNVQFVETKVVERRASSAARSEEPVRKIKSHETDDERITADRGEDLDPFADRPLPFVIGTSNFSDDPLAGLDTKSGGHIDLETVAEYEESRHDSLPEQTWESEEHARSVFGAVPPASSDNNPMRMPVAEDDPPSVSSPSFMLTAPEPKDAQLAHLAPVASIPPVGSVVERQMIPPAATSMSKPIYEEEDDLFSAPAFIAPLPPAPSVPASISQTISLGAKPITAAKEGERGPPPPPPRRTRDLLFDDVDDDDLGVTATFARIAPPMMIQPPTTAQPLRAATIPVTQQPNADRVKSAAAPSSVQTPDQADVAKVVKKKGGLFDDDEDDDEDDGLVY